MARFIDESPEYQPEDGETFATLDEDDMQIPEEEQPVEPEEIQETQEEDDIPEKYQGKAIKDIVQMHQEAEKLLGKQSSEVGELRKIVDDFVKTQLDKANSPQEDEEEIDFFDDPQKAVERAIAKHPKIKEAEDVTRAMKQQEILNKLKRSHADFESIIKDPKYGEWIAASKVRTGVYQRAERPFDFDSADELLTTWKERQNIVAETAEMQDADRKRQLKAASTGSAKGSTEKPSRKIYRRADILNLMQNDRQRYEMLMPEIRQAYAEGRVK